jgi:hypothetical protein
VPFDLTVTAVDPFGQVAVGYAGTAIFIATDPDPRVVLPADYTFTAGDAGVHTFTDTGLGETTLLTRGQLAIAVVAASTVRAVCCLGGTWSDPVSQDGTEVVEPGVSALRRSQYED